MAYPLGIISRIVTGKYADIYFDRVTETYQTRPKTGFVYVYPAVSQIRVGDTIVDLSEVNPQRVEIDETGTFSFEAIVTDQDGISPNNGWTYRVVTSWGERTAEIPVLSTLPATIDITDYFDTQPVPGMIITKGDPGRGIDHITSAGNIATVHFDDGTTDTFELPLGDGSGGDTPDATASIKGKLRLTKALTGNADAPDIAADYITPAMMTPAVRTSLGKADTAVQPAGLTKAAVGLGNVDNTSDVNKPVSNATQAALNMKVNISSLHTVATTGSYNDLVAKPFIPDSKDDIGLGNVDNTADIDKPISTAVQSALNGKANINHDHPVYIKTVNSVTPDTNGNVDVGANWDDITGKPTTFPPSTHTHSYASLTDIPNTFAPSAHTHAQADIVGLGTTLDGKANSVHTHVWADITDKPNTFVPSAHTHVVADISDASEIGADLMQATDPGNARSIIGAGTSNLTIGTTGSTAAAGNHVHDYATLTNIPSTFAPSAHNHVIVDITGLQDALDGKAATAHTHIMDDITGLNAALAGKANASDLTLKADLVGGKLPTSQLPNNALIRAIFKANTTEMLALTNADVQNGDIVRITGGPSYYTLVDDQNIDDLNSWVFSPGTSSNNGSETVTTVNGQVGDVVLGKADIGLGNVDNTSDVNKPISAATQTALDGKANVAHTHAASDISNSTSVGRAVLTAADGAAARTAIGASNLVIGTTSTTAKAGDYIPSWTEITNKPTEFTPSAHTHVVADISDITEVGIDLVTAVDAAAARNAINAAATNHNHDATYAPLNHTHLWADITDKPTTFAPIIGTTSDTAAAGNHNHNGVYEPVIAAGIAGQYYRYDKTWADLNVAAVDGAAPLASPALTGTPTAPTATAGTNTTQIATTQFVQTGLSGKANTSHTHVWADITDKPTTFAPSAHSHAIADVTGLQAALDSKEPAFAGGTNSEFLRGDKTFVAITKSTVGLGNVDNTSDATKFTNTALTGTPTAPTAAPGTNTTQIATTAFVTAGLSGKADSGHTHSIANVTGLQTALDAKAPLDSPAFTGTVTGISKGMVGLGNVDNTSDANKPVSTAQQTALNLKANIDNPTFTTKITTPALQVTGGTIASGRILVSDGSGNATWQPNRPVFRDTSTNWNASAGALASSVITQETDTGKVKIGNGTDAYSALAYVKTDWSDILNKPSAFTPSAHTHAIADVTNLQSSLDAKAPLASPTFTGTVSGITKSMVGLGNVDNTSDANKPVSTAQQAALDLKANLASPTFTGTPAAPTATAGTNTTQIATTAFVQSGLSGKANASHTHAIADVTNLQTTLDGKAAAAHTHAIADVTNLQTTLDAKAGRANGVLGTGIPWYAELMVNGSGALANGFNDVPGGVQVDRDIVLESMVFRIADPSATIGGSGNLTITWSYGSMTTTTPTTITTTTIAQGQHDIWVVLETPLAISINNCLRASFALGTTTVTTPCHVQWRGRYA